MDIGNISMDSADESMDIGNHPCFNRGARTRFGRVHLPVAPACNIQCNYCNRQFDCANEGRPGVTSRLMSPGEAVVFLERSLSAAPISVAGIAGPGDPLANPERTFATLKLVRRMFPGLLLCLSTNGLAGPDHLDDILDAGISHVTVTVNAVNPEIGAHVYGSVAKLDGAEGAALLLERQTRTIRLLKRSGIIVKVNSVIIPGINDHHVVDIARMMRRLKVDLFNAMPLYPVTGTPFAKLPEPSKRSVAWLRRLAGAYLPQMTHCARCRADAAGLLTGECGKMEAEAGNCGQEMTLSM